MKRAINFTIFNQNVIKRWVNYNQAHILPNLDDVNKYNQEHVPKNLLTLRSELVEPTLDNAEVCLKGRKQVI